MQIIDAARSGGRLPPGGDRQPGGLAPLRPRRGPRPEEIALMRGLAAGPRAISEGPIGRCVKRGWCRAVVVEQGEGAARTSAVVFALTDLGRALIA